MADGKALELKEGARIAVVSTVYEEMDKDGKKGQKRLFKVSPTDPKKAESDSGKQIVIQTRTEDGSRFVQRTLLYPFPAGLAADPMTGKEAAKLSPQQLGHAIGEWLKELELLNTNGGVVSVVNSKGQTVVGSVPTDIIPTVSEILCKGFSLGIQGPVNQQMVKDFITTTGKPSTVTQTKIRDISSIG